ncbi:uncharacterized protein LOC130735580 [Lotus japonicus]|uniref:uncharacterized protein LOC130735580 n=1 Tax=Lotus japonicus TaxID=34305 RepID=UPI0025866A20|nr:uncharacterized protein LOC130735580 [Lotus japonicus]
MSDPSLIFTASQTVFIHPHSYPSSSPPPPPIAPQPPSPSHIHLPVPTCQKRWREWNPIVRRRPEGKWSPEDILELLQSPPFRQQVDSFTYVLKTGQIDLSQFGIDPSKYKFTVLSFLEALEDSVLKSVEPEESRQDDLRSQSCNRHDPMDESK